VSLKMNLSFAPSHYSFNPYALTYFFSGMFVAAEGIFVCFQNRKSIINLSFAAVTVCAGIWLTGVGLVLSSVSESNAIIWARYYCWFGIIFITPCLHLFSLGWAMKSVRERRRFLWFNFLSALAFYTVCFSSSYLVEGVWSFPWGYYPKAGFLHKYFLIWFSFQVFMIFRNFSYGFKNEVISARKKQTQYIILAFIFGVFMGSVDFLANYGVRLHSIGSIAIVIFSSIIAYSIVNYKLMDIETVIHKTILWTLSFSIVFIPIFLIYRQLFSRIQFSPFLQIGFWGAGFIIFAVYLRLVQPKIDHIFQRRKADLEEISNRFGEDLVQLKGVDNLVRRIEETILNTLYSQRADIYIYNEKKKNFALANRTNREGQVLEFDRNHVFLDWLGKNNQIVHKDYVEIDPKYASVKDEARDYFHKTRSTVTVPLVLDNTLLGVITLDKKANLAPYNALDFQFLRTLKNQSAIAISNSLIYQNIEEQVKLRTAELVEMQKQLIQAEKLATVGTLSGGVAHEINNPLAAILTSVQTLLAFSDGDKAEVDRDSLELIEEATQRCRTIVQKLMVYAKKPLESDGTKKTDLSRALEKVTDFLGYQMDQDGIKIVTEIKDGDYFIEGNHNEIEQVLTNIILNAHDATRQVKKGGRILVRLSHSKEKIKVEVKDEGCGIDRDVIGKIFDPFFTTKDVGKGLGLGLSICHSIVEKHEGTITVESKKDKGSTFTIVFPGYSQAKEAASAVEHETQ